MTTVTFHNCQVELLDKVTPYGATEFRKWANRPGYQAVVDFVKSFEHSYLFELTPEDVRSAMKRSTHPLGNVRTQEQLSVIENFSTPFAYQHLFHWYLETHKKVPTWTEFRKWMVEGPAAEHWYRPLKSYLEGNAIGFTKVQWSRAARWRLGKVYMSNMRELDLLVRLREQELPIHYHLLADVLLRVDFWCKNVLVCLYFPNPTYRAGEEGRKPSAQRYFDTKNNKFEIVHVGIERQGFGRFWLATDESVRDLAVLIRQKMTS